MRKNFAPMVAPKYFRINMFLRAIPLEKKSGCCFLPFVLQVTVLPKKKKTEDDSSSKPVEPETLAEKVAAALPTVLKDSSDARTASIKLGTTEYAGELAKQLLDHARKLEQLYTRMSEAMAPGSNVTDKELKRLVNELETLTAFGTKAQVGVGNVKQHLHT